MPEWKCKVNPLDIAKGDHLAGHQRERKPSMGSCLEYLVAPGVRRTSCPLSCQPG